MNSAEDIPEGGMEQIVIIVGRMKDEGDCR